MLLVHSCIQIDGTDAPKGLDADILKKEQSPQPQQETYEARSLLGKILIAPVLEERLHKKRTRDLDQARKEFEISPDSLYNIIWYGRRLSYLYQYRQSIQVYTDGLKKYPHSFKLYRHRGHRYLTLRQFDKAIIDLEKAVFYSRNTPIEMEVDGLPNKRNIPRNSIQYNIWYHLGLAYYMQGNFDKCVSAYKKCLAIADNDDMLVAATDWLYMTYRKTGNLEAAEALLEPIKSRMNIIENFPYLNRLLMYKGQKMPEQLFDIDNATELTIENMTLAYGVGNWYYYNGETEKALLVFNKMMESPYWQAFGFIAAEVELANLAPIGS